VSAPPPDDGGAPLPFDHDRPERPAPEGLSRPGPPPSAGEPEGPTVPPTKVGSAWLALTPALAFLVVVIVFIVENRQDVQVSFFGAHWTLPLGVDLLLAAVLGGLVVFLLGSLRILQLRRVARQHHEARRRAERRTGPGSPS
jgi:uncharacterized integral membrane protein